MSSDSRNVEDELKKWPQKDRARIAMSLISSLDPGADEDAEALWLEEAGKRLDAYDAGEARSRPVSEVITEIKSDLE